MKEQVRDQHVFAPAYAALARRQTRLPDGSSRWPPDAAIEAFYPDCPPQLASWAASKLGRQVWTIFDETTPLEAWPPVGAVSILCREDRVVSPDWSRRVSTERLGRPAVELDGGHPREVGPLGVRHDCEAPRRDVERPDDHRASLLLDRGGGGIGVPDAEVDH